MKTHTLQDRLDGINTNCRLSQSQIKGCFGYGLIGDRACDNRHIPGFKEGDIVRVCTHNKLWAILKLVEDKKLVSKYLRGEITQQELLDKGIKPVMPL